MSSAAVVIGALSVYIYLVTLCAMCCILSTAKSKILIQSTSACACAKSPLHQIKSERMLLRTCKGTIACLYSIMHVPLCCSSNNGKGHPSGPTTLVQSQPDSNHT